MCELCKNEVKRTDTHVRSRQHMRKLIELFTYYKEINYKGWYSMI